MALLEYAAQFHLAMALLEYLLEYAAQFHLAPPQAATRTAYRLHGFSALSQSEKRPAASGAPKRVRAPIIWRSPRGYEAAMSRRSLVSSWHTLHRPPPLIETLVRSLGLASSNSTSRAPDGLALAALPAVAAVFSTRCSAVCGVSVAASSVASRCSSSAQQDGGAPSCAEEASGTATDDDQPHRPHSLQRQEQREKHG